ncbi:zinc-binding dehydrogenase [Podospora appendiculata]|uniref:Zinc-binding dehydrogenase n=1 Tax=Podospora appendiculata TaxID=314037 RepID=A0AAE0X1R4_9PEZI|nr:zinc-binding dehydrogenase [Podospora appendiculata]
MMSSQRQPSPYHQHLLLPLQTQSHPLLLPRVSLNTTQTTTPVNATMPDNRAAYITAKSVLEVKSAPYTPPGPDELVVKNGAVAVNPFDWIKQVVGGLMFTYMKYPFILGSDIAGEVVQVGAGGEAAKLFRVGDRVVGHAFGMDHRSAKTPEGAFQHYSVLRYNLTAKIPDTLSYASACVLPLGLSTAATGLFMKKNLGLALPTPGPTQPKNQTFIVWGGSTSVGSNAIQLARAAGYEVIATASPKNFEYLKRLGATQVYDYHSATAVTDIIAALKGKICAGAIAIGAGSLEACVDIVGASEAPPGQRKFVCQTSFFLPPSQMPGSLLGFTWLGMRMLRWNAAMFVKGKRGGVEFKFAWGGDLVDGEVAAAVYNRFLPAALASGEFVAAPEPVVVGHGLEHLQEAFDLNRKGMSAGKAVVTL